MIAPDDPRHGTVAGYNRIPCRDACCKRAMANYKKRLVWDRMNGRNRIVPALGARRRVQALNRLGWSNQVIAVEAGIARTNMTRLLYRSDTITATTAAKFAEVYERLSMRLPTPTQSTAYVRNRAERMGWPPPLAWNNPDDPDEHPEAWEYAPVDPRNVYAARDVDPVVVMRLLEGARVRANKAEKEAAMAQWIADGGSARELASWHGWKAERYTRHLRAVGEAS